MEQESPLETPRCNIVLIGLTYSNGQNISKDHAFPKTVKALQV